MRYVRRWLHVETCCGPNHVDSSCFTASISCCSDMSGCVPIVETDTSVCGSAGSSKRGQPGGNTCQIAEVVWPAGVRMGCYHSGRKGNLKRQTSPQPDRQLCVCAHDVPALLVRSWAQPLTEAAVVHQTAATTKPAASCPMSLQRLITNSGTAIALLPVLLEHS
jgi:hypothetical protein